MSCSREDTFIHVRTQTGTNPRASGRGTPPAPYLVALGAVLCAKEGDAGVRAGGEAGVWGSRAEAAC